METLEHLRASLHTVDDLGALVRTMKALAQVNIHQSEHAVRAVQMYLRTVELGLHALLPEAGRTGALRPPRVPRDAPQGVVVFGSDHGLCGRFNDDIAAHALDRVALARGDGASVRVLAVGARVATRLEHDGEGQVAAPEAVFEAPGSTVRAARLVQRVLAYLDRWQADGVARVRLFYNRSGGATRYAPATQRMLPVDLTRIETLQTPWPSRGRPMHTMGREALLASVLRQYLFVVLFRACAESLAAEHGARLAAMQAAEKSLGERGDELAQQYRSKRQELITAELLDVIGGYEVSADAVR
ncbi:MAG: F0F1 ATP synthase subunit gamma [Burkholderiales bacterium]|nr:MAG: F0F1 ATP synthase subunit gamma [Burkholderiales bacterium]